MPVGFGNGWRLLAVLRWALITTLAVPANSERQQQTLQYLRRTRLGLLLDGDNWCIGVGCLNRLHRIPAGPFQRLYPHPASHLPAYGAFRLYRSILPQPVELFPTHTFGYAFLDGQGYISPLFHPFLLHRSFTPDFTSSWVERDGGRRCGRFPEPHTRQAASLPERAELYCPFVLPSSLPGRGRWY